MARIADDNQYLTGSWGRIEFAVRQNGSMPARDFITGLHWKERIKLLALLQRMADTGKIWNKQQFKQVEGKIFEFKSNQLRVLCFQHSNSWVLTHGFRKKRDKLPRKEKETAKEIMTEHLGWR